jgi:iron complex outermembrane recepter protein
MTASASTSTTGCGSTAIDLSGRRVFDETSASGGLIWHWRPGQQAFANAATAFETPTFTEFANPAGTGGFNPDLESQYARSMEIGPARRGGYPERMT